MSELGEFEVSPESGRRENQSGELEVGDSARGGASARGLLGAWGRVSYHKIVLKISRRS